ncbi:MAG: 50S ribosomal protein L11, partial [Candidatus Micrarchaeota archaeon]
GKKVIGNLTFDQVVKVANMKRDSTLAKTLTAGVMEVLGTCVSLGVTVEGKKAQEVQAEIKEGKWKAKLKE